MGDLGDAIKIINSKGSEYYCINECVERCCDFNNGGLKLSEDELFSIYRGRLKKLRKRVENPEETLILELRETKNLFDYKGHYILQDTICPMNIEGLCRIHDEKRPEVCYDHPVHTSNGIVYMEMRCIFVQKEYMNIAELIRADHPDVEMQLHFARGTRTELVPIDTNIDQKMIEFGYHN